ncbi:magnetosome-associated protein MamJ-like [Colias croceus]|uniref:magnetosome-associated protein MamJ-like n=1 Tax=Colias crocea TaxID=72248 RepID=UPI001E27F373|nr:magnetosome-associated protein MamJ-like [Colias croceus]
MKFLIVLAFVAVASAATLPQKRINQAELDEILAAIHSPSTHPATAAALEQMLQDLLGAAYPIQVGPAVIDPVDEISVGPVVVEPVEEIAVGPAIIDPVEEISVGPAIIDPVEEISVGPAIIDPVEEISVGPALIDPPAFNPFPFNGPLVQVVVNVNSASSGSVVVEQPALVPAPGADLDQIKPEPVVVVDAPEPVVIAPEPVNVGNPIFPDLAINLPEPLN